MSLGFSVDFSWLHFFLRDTRTEKKHMHAHGSCSSVPEHSGLTHDCDQGWSIYIHLVFMYLYIYIYLHKNFEPDGGHWAGAGMAFQIYESGQTENFLDCQSQRWFSRFLESTNHDDPTGAIVPWDFQPWKWKWLTLRFSFSRCSDWFNTCSCLRKVCWHRWGKLRWSHLNPNLPQSQSSLRYHRCSLVLQSILGGRRNKTGCSRTWLWWFRITFSWRTWLFGICCCCSIRVCVIHSNVLIGGLTFPN